MRVPLCLRFFSRANRTGGSKIGCTVTVDFSEFDIRFRRCDHCARLLNSALLADDLGPQAIEIGFGTSNLGLRIVDANTQTSVVDLRNESACLYWLIIGHSDTCNDARYLWYDYRKVSLNVGIRRALFESFCFGLVEKVVSGNQSSQRKNTDRNAEGGDKVHEGVISGLESIGWLYHRSAQAGLLQRFPVLGCVEGKGRAVSAASPECQKCDKYLPQRGHSPIG
nr:hypothetical protein [Rhizobium sp. P28RR-XV]